MHLLMAIGVQEHAVSCAVRSAVRPPDAMMIMPSRQVRNRLMTDRTKTALLSPQVQQFASSLEVICHGHAEALFKVDFPGRVKRIRCAFDLRVPLDRHPGGGEQPDGWGGPVVARSFAAKDPVAPADGVAVGFLNPSPGLVGMPAFCPLPEGKEDRVVHFAKGLLPTHSSFTNLSS
jgi:hypothetical protein